MQRATLVSLLTSKQKNTTQLHNKQMFSSWSFGGSSKKEPQSCQQNKKTASVTPAAQQSIPANQFCQYVKQALPTPILDEAYKVGIF